MRCFFFLLLCCFLSFFVCLRTRATTNRAFGNRSFHSLFLLALFFVHILRNLNETSFRSCAALSGRLWFQWNKNVQKFNKNPTLMWSKRIACWCYSSKQWIRIEMSIRILLRTIMLVAFTRRRQNTFLYTNAGSALHQTKDAQKHKSNNPTTMRAKKKLKWYRRR